ncbi:hypothetical protein, partial [Mycobacteroides abscessus]
IDGRHVLEVIPRRAGTLVRHTLDLECTLRDWITLTAVVVPAHDAVMEQLLDNLEHALTGTVKQRYRWSVRVHVIRRALGMPTPRSR